MITEDLEFAISQYADGTLDPAERSAVEELLRTSPHAQAVLAEYQKLDQTLADVKAMGIGPVDWAGFTAQINHAIDRHEEAEETRRAKRFRLRPATIGWWGAIAASVAITFAVGLQMFRSSTSRGLSPTQIVINTPPPQAPLNITLLADRSAPPAVASAQVIAIGPSTRLRDEPSLWRYSAEITSRPRVSFIASSARSAQDSPFLPF